MHNQVECWTLSGGKTMVPKEKLVFRPAAHAVVLHEGKLLLTHTKSTGKYWFPGGGLDVGETIEGALRRELMEETGIQVEIVKFLTFVERFFYYEPLDEAYHNFGFYFLCRPLNTQILDDSLVDQTDESEKPRWIEAAAITPDQMQNGTEKVFELIKNELAIR